MTNFTSKLIKAQATLKAPKGQYNSFAKFRYRSAEDILEAVKPINSELGLLLTLSDKPVYIGDRHYIEATATITDGTDKHVVTAYAREQAEKRGMDESQISGTASSYARKYALNGLYLIDDTKDADTDEHTNQTNRPQRTQKSAPNQPKADRATAKQVGEVKVKALEFAKLRGRSADDVYKVLKITNIESLTKQQAVAAIKQLDVWIEGVKNANTKNKS